MKERSKLPEDVALAAAERHVDELIDAYQAGRWDELASRYAGRRPRMTAALLSRNRDGHLRMLRSLRARRAGWVWISFTRKVMAMIG